VQVLAARRQAIVGLLANTSAVAKQLSGLVHDNEQQLAPTLDKLNSVMAVLEKNRDNIAKALPGLAKYQATLGETLPADPITRRLLPTLFHRCCNPSSTTPSGSGEASTPGNHPTRRTAGRIPVPVQRDTPTGRAVAALINRRRMAAATAAVLATLLAAATILLVRHEWLRPTTVTAYFATATSIYPGATFASRASGWAESPRSSRMALKSNSA